MTAPIWTAFPPEFHSALLSSGAGPGPLLAAAAAWTRLSTEYADAAGELTALMGSVHAEAWQGHSAEAYTAANTAYVAWLAQAATDAAATAARQETAAGAYTAALAAMPTLAELAANHAHHAALLATNFFGINTIPIALNEADYARMWIQAATAMSTYHQVSTTALAAAPHPTPAPPILKSADPATAPDQPQTLPGFLQQVYNYLFGEAPGVHGNETIQQFLFGVPHGTTMSSLLATDIAQDQAIIEAIAGFTGGNPALQPVATMISTSVLVFEHIPLQIAQFYITFPGLAAPTAAAPLTALPGLAGGAAGLSGLAGLHGPDLASAGAEAILPAQTAPTVLITGPAPAPTVSAPVAPAPTPVATAPAAPPAPGAPPAPSTGPGPFPYLAGGWTPMSSRTSAQARAKQRAPKPDLTAAAPAAAAATREPTRARRRRRARRDMPDHGYEYMDLAGDSGPGGSPAGPNASAIPSDRGAGTLGFAGVAQAVAEAAGLTTLAGDKFGGDPSEPMLPRTWKLDESGAMNE
ncbi:PPE family protein [Mycobacterium sp.]|uniref:PPE family protein n=1 Tax=Mycobacterium sp. TaxID=1785 RepID=UPI00126E2FFF|nr:PPE family protein [Mycobacterium sp.]KAA8958646.1 MAG: PPE family protein [Mycobacterium sp.]